MIVNISKVLQESNLIDEFIKNEVDSISPERLATKPNPETWSIIEVIQHLNLVSDLYYPRFESAIKKLNTQAFEGEIADNQKVSWIAGQLANMMKPKGNKRKLKMDTFDFFKPERAQLDVEKILNTYKDNRAKLNHYIKMSRKPIARRVVVTSAIKLLKFTLPGAIYWLLSHEQRHIIQIQEIQFFVQKKEVV